jgi:thioredoxin reductase (NADPH)
MSENNLLSVAFPTLAEAQINKLGACSNAAPRLFRDGEALFNTGDRDVNFFIVKSGEIEIIDYSGDEPKTVTVHKKGQFTGDISHLTGLPVVVSAVARGDCRAAAAPDMSG